MMSHPFLNLIFSASLAVANPLYAVAQSTPAEAFQSQCETSLRQIRTQNPQYLDVRFAIGYNEGGVGGSLDEVLDDENTATLLQALQRRGFVQISHSVAEKKTSLEKNNVFPDGTTRIVKITLTESAYSKDDRKNRVEFKTQQKAQTRVAEDNFLSGLRDADVTFYLGHSRVGGVPSFSPPLLLSNRHENYGYYRSHPFQRAKMENAIALRHRAKPIFVGIYSCFSKKYFGENLLREVPGGSFASLSTDAIRDDEMMAGAINSLEFILHGSCPRYKEELASMILPKHRFQLMRH